jgi:hypothetical protein
MSDASPAVILQRWAERPVFHLLLPWGNGGGHQVTRSELDDGRIRVEHRTLLACGRTHDRWGWIEDPTVETWYGRTSDEHRTEHGIVLRRDHAEKIGRLCRRCAPHDA